MHPTASPSNPFTRPNPFAAPTAAAAPVATHARHAQRASAFERRFLSERFRGGPGMLEIAALWRNNVVAVDSFRDPRVPVTVGARGATYLVESTLLAENATLLSARNGHWVLEVLPGMEGFVVAAGRDGRSRRLRFEEAVAAGLGRPTASGGFVIAITGTTRARVSIGEQAFLVHYVSAPSLRLPLVAQVGFASLVAAILLSLVAHLAFGALVSLSTDKIDELTIDTMLSNDAFGDALVMPEIVEEPEPEPVTPQDTAATSDGAPALSAKLGQHSDDAGSPGGERGERSAGLRGGQPDARTTAQEAGLLPGLGQLVAHAGQPSHFDDATLGWNSFDGKDPTAPGGYGLNATNAGCVGANCYTSFTGPGHDGRLNTGGKGDPNGDPNGIGPRTTLAEKDKPTRKPELRPQPIDSSGQLTAAQIRKVINAHKGELKALYSKVLLKDKGAHGKLVVQFIVDGQGNVVTASVSVLSDTLGDRDLAKGLVAAIKQWRFPAVKDGGMTKVKYPFVFEVK